nr:hypothetical protein [uncultured Treponema sp.]
MMEDRLNDYSDKRKMIESLDICEKKIQNISISDVKRNNIVLQVLLSFMTFESDFFESPIFISEEKKDYGKSVFGRIIEIQNEVLKLDVPVEKMTWLIQFQKYFRRVYLENGKESDRFKSLYYSQDNLEGLYEDTVSHIKHFLLEDFNRHGKFYKLNSDFAIVNALRICYLFRNNLCHGKKRLVKFSRKHLKKISSRLHRFFWSL